jgi:hypothetical protein
LQDLINTNTVCSKSLKILYKLCLVLLYIKIWNIASHPTRRGFIVIAIVILFVLRSLYGNLLNSMLTPREGGGHYVGYLIINYIPTLGILISILSPS